MDQVLLSAFITGLTAGGLSCLAVQGGLITSSLANQVETNLMDAQLRAMPQRSSPKKALILATTILVFLLAKLVSHTILGGALGELGSVLTLTALTRGILQIAIAIFMIGNALRMLNVHPVFRYFSFEPPSSVTRFIRRSSHKTTFFTPVLLGLLTIFIPCGITQSMMALAIGTGSPLTGAAIMFAYILGTIPVFFAITFLATELSSLVEKYFTRIIAAILLILGLVVLDNGLNLTGSPVSITRLSQNIVLSVAPPTPTPALLVIAPTENAPSDEITIKVLNGGYSPSHLDAPANKALKLKLVTKDVTSCALSIVIPPLKYSAVLPQTGTEIVDIPPQKAGTIFRYSCSMGMYTGEIEFKE
ncbi:MAG: sulfite exporter TauE/SafE family protein [Anaerolineaceae bacterium]|nr:sulfite exporter TauE/SafE family protein [Anaerolineaceae bacterium]